MRTIKVRVWDSKYEKMYYSHGDNPRVELFRGEWEIDLEGENGDTIGTVGCDDKTYPLMEYTGIKDCNDIEICEGDTDGIYVVEWFENLCYDTCGAWHSGFYLEYYGVERDDRKELDWGLNLDETFEVKGNIYENPELR